MEQCGDPSIVGVITITVNTAAWETRDARRRLRRSAGIQLARIVGREEPIDDRDLASFDLRLITESNLLSFVRWVSVRSP